MYCGCFGMAGLGHDVDRAAVSYMRCAVGRRQSRVALNSTVKLFDDDGNCLDENAS
jgi:hypothetical protein